MYNVYQARNAKESFFVRPETLDEFVINECYGTVYFKDFIKYKPTDIVLDAGANIAGYSTRVSKLVSKVYSYEPDKENYSQAKQNLERNNVTNVELYNSALVSSDVSEITFYVNNLKNKGMHSILETRGRTAVTVNAYSFSKALKESNANKVKMDIEGGEWDLFTKSDIDWSNVDTLMMEWHQSALKDKSQVKFDWLVEYLGKNFTTVIAPRPTKKAWHSIVYALK